MDNFLNNIVNNIMAGIVANLIIAVVPPLIWFGWPHFRDWIKALKTKHDKRRGGIAPADDFEKHGADAIKGFFVAIFAGFVWGAGNVVTRYTVRDYPEASFDVSFVKYLMAGSFLVGMAMVARQGTRARLAPFDRSVFRQPSTFVGAVAKGLDSYFWILSAALVTAGIAATLENMHILWTLGIVTILSKETVPREWLVSTLSLVLGVVLITGFHSISVLSKTNTFGIVLGVLSGLGFSIFTVCWSRVRQRSALFWQRTMEMGVFMLTTAIIVYPVHLVIRAFWLGGELIPLRNMPFFHIAIQAVSGLIGLSLTYLLINESLWLMKGTGNYASLLVGLGISYSVLFTLIIEHLWFGEEFTALQGIGVLLFSVGFSSIRKLLMTSASVSPE